MIQTNKDISPEQVKRDLFYLGIAYKVSMALSKDKSTKTGAIIVIDNSIIRLGDNIAGVGANTVPFGVDVEEWMLERPAKYDLEGHAERHSIYNAAWKGRSTWGATLYSPYFLCGPCADGAINSRIGTVVFHSKTLNWSKEELKENQKDWSRDTDIGRDLLERAKYTTYRMISGDIGGGIESLFKDKIRYP
jgi:deoxycytidylate deaminase